MSLPLKWEFPGGKIEEMENESDALIREIKEELNIYITPLKRLTPSVYSYPKFSITLIPYIAQILSGEIFLHEHSDMCFLPLAELEILDWADADIPIVKQLIKEVF